MQSLESDLHPISPKTSAVSNCFVYIKMLITEKTKHLFNLSIRRTVSEKKLFDQIIHTMSKLMNMSIYT